MPKRIQFSAPGVTEICEYDLPELNSNEVRVRLAVSTISSGTERANLLGDPRLSVWGFATTFPRCQGYSSAGVIVEVGSEVPDLKVGDRVAICWSTHSEIVTIAYTNVYKLPDEISFSNASIYNIASFPLAAIRKCKLEIGESAIVMGMGILGLMAIPLLKVAGAAPIIAVDPVKEKREKAMASGADYALDPLAPDFAETVKRITNGGAKVGNEVTGAGAGLNGILDCMAKFGRVALLGCTRNSDFSVDYYGKVHGPGITLIGAHTSARPDNDSFGGWWTQRADVEALIKLTQFGRIDLSSLVDEIHSVNKGVEIFDRLKNEKSFPVVQLDWSDLK